MSIFFNRSKASSAAPAASAYKTHILCISVASMALIAGGVWSETASAQVLAQASQPEDLETVVVTGTAFNPDMAPAKASLDTMQPETIINRSYIEDSVAPTADYVTLLAIVPSLTGLSINGPGLSDGNVKNTLRGMPDGNFGLSFDNIPFGDTNGPTHHSESYFPASVIGSTLVDRGPGNAGTLGAATYGGTIKLFSEPLTHEAHGRIGATYGSWDTTDTDANLQTGDFDTFGRTSRLMVNFQEITSGGYLTLQSTHHDNELIKLETDIAPGWTLTAFANRNYLGQIVNDNNGATPAQAVTYGKQFALQNTNAKLPSYAAYNPESKQTDMDYLRLQGSLFNGLEIDDQAYTYAYFNKTVTTSDPTQTLSDIIANKGEGLGTKVNGKSFPNDIQGYTKLNAYRVWGNILRTSFDYDFGRVTGQVRAGLWSEWQATERQRFYLDITQCAAANGGTCPGFAVQQSGAFANAGTKSGTVYGGVPGVGYYEHTGWSQYQPFVETDIKPIEGLTLTPGLKYVWWRHTIAPNSLIKGKPPQTYVSAATPNNMTEFTTTRMLPFFEANYRLGPSWSVYAQYANGMYVPDISVFEVTTPVDTFPKPQTTTNYQVGTVYYGDNVSMDADIYYINSDNTIEQDTCNNVVAGGTPFDTCNYNAGTAIFKGIEGETTYAFDADALDGALEGLAVFANGSLNSARVQVNPNDPNSGSLQDRNAPFWTAAGGLIFKSNGWKLSLIDKLTGQQYMDAVSKRANDYVGGQDFYRLPTYNHMDFTGSYDFGSFVAGSDLELGFGIYNILNERNVVSIGINDKSVAAGGAASSAVDLADRMNSLDQYYFLPARSYQLTLKAHF